MRTRLVISAGFLSLAMVNPFAPLPGLYGIEQESSSIAIIRALYSEVWLDQFRETHGHGQGSRLSGQAESRDAGLNTAAPTTAE